MTPAKAQKAHGKKVFEWKGEEEHPHPVILRSEATKDLMPECKM